MRASPRIARPCLCLAALFVVSCGGAETKKEADPLVLLSKGHYAEARAAVQAKGVTEPRDRAIVALAWIAENPSAETREKATNALTEGTSGVGAAASAVDMLELAFGIPQPVETLVSMTLAEVALGAVGVGPLTSSASPAIPVGVASRSLAVMVLERVYMAFGHAEVSIDTDKLLSIWNSCFTLAGGSGEANDDVEAWRLFCSIGGLAVVMNDAAPNSDLSNVLLGAAVVVVEANPSIAIAARCDLASPFDKLKVALTYKRDLLGRLEGALASATGCTRGTYAPR
ncbi:MAG: hypothetical protein GY854_26765 [Deltaproteobacteria bacterium]|nr:hypothetical protein [Deltaproteobacteria bacterium]